ncbi:ankyrin repeat-containing protein [Legionella geestiana]|uniref:Ankyrin repeat-containing protein n=1 Tax=Legionella geestiana TaxID=45065 RepID=A0A0W0TGL1_9GAMM|nr:ankyrin repeat domain-containing protein [Legionella geestiana]KTC94753.1 ankyrin repeat-containing protein [Legionella geestiana]STX54842.1 ankyrin repeat-containing protein [Legionella geestiana]
MPKRDAPESERLSPEQPSQQRRYQLTGASSSSAHSSGHTVSWQTQFHTHFPLWYSGNMEGNAQYWEEIYKGSVKKLSILVPHQNIRSEWKMLFGTRSQVGETVLRAPKMELLCQALITGIKYLEGFKFRDACNLVTFLHHRMPSTLADALYTAATSTEAAQSPLFWAIVCRQQLTDDMFSGLNDDTCLPALHLAVLLNDRTLLQQLLDAGADILKKNHEGESAFFVAAKTGKAGMLDALYSVNAILLDEPDSTGNTPLHAAADAGHLEVLRYLSSHGADINRRNHEGATPLLTVCEGDSDICLVRHLVDNGADIEIPDDSGFTPLLTAVWADKEDIAKYLLDKGASPHKTEASGKGALHFAAENDNVELIKRLAVRFEHFDIHDESRLTPLHVAAWTGCTESAQFLLANGANPSCMSANGSTPLHLAIIQDAFDVVKLLLKYNIDINEGWRTGHTALACAALSGRVHMLLYLLKKGATLNLPGQSAFGLLQSAVHNRHIDVVIALFLSKALSEYDCQHFLEYAVTSRHSDVIDVCFQSGYYLHHRHMPPALRDELQKRSDENKAMRQGSLQAQATFALEKNLAVYQPRTIPPLKPLRVMPIGYGPDGRNYLDNAMNGCMRTLLWINAYDRQINGSVVSWLKKAHDTPESFCIAVNLTGLRHGCFLPLSAKQLKKLYRATPDSLTELVHIHGQAVVRKWLTTLANAEEMSNFHDRYQRLSHYLLVEMAAEKPVAIEVPAAPLRGQRRITEFFQPRAPEEGTQALAGSSDIIRPS